MTKNGNRWVIRADELWSLDRDFATEEEAISHLRRLTEDEHPHYWVAMAGGRWIRFSTITRFDIFQPV